MKLKNYMPNFLKKAQKGVSYVVSAISGVAPTLSIFGFSKKEAIEQGYLYNPDVYSVVSFIAGKAASLEMELKDKNDDVVAPKDNQTRRLLTNPNRYSTFNDLIEQMVGFLAITGDAFLHAPRLDSGNNTGKLLPDSDFSVIPSHLITPRVTTNGDIIEYVYFGKVIPKEDIIHINLWNPLSVRQGAIGLSPISAGRLAISRNNKNYEAATKMFDNMGAVGMLTGDGSTNSLQVTPKQKKDIQDEYKKMFARKGEIIIAQTNLKWHNFGMSPADLKLIEDRKMGIKEICNLYHLPSALFGDGESTQYANIQNARKIAWTDGILPLLDKIIAVLNVEIFSKDDLHLSPKIGDIPEMQEDIKTKVEWLAQAWWIKASRKQELMDEEPDPKLDMYFVPAGMLPYGGVEGVSDVPSEEEVDKFYERANL